MPNAVEILTALESRIRRVNHPIVRMETKRIADAMRQLIEELKGKQASLFPEDPDVAPTKEPKRGGRRHDASA